MKIIMKFKIFTKGHKTEVLNSLNWEKRFSSQEHTDALKKEFSNIPLTKASILRDFLSKESKKLNTLSYLIRFVYANDYKKILSLGAGSCVIEYLLKAALPEDSIVVATDFNGFFIDNAKQFFKSIVPVEFDFFHDDIDTIARSTGIDFDIAYFMNSSYVMDDDDYIRILKQLKQNRIKKVIDLTSTLIPLWSLPKTIANEIKCIIFKQSRGKFHGFARTKNEFRSIYRESGWHLSKETEGCGYNYVAILENRSG
jgi:hypothetical protein